jgi:nucleoside-diphosphate-sugar epimerase
VIHCAATGGPDLDPVRRVNSEGTRSMVDAALGAGATRFIHISTVSVYRTDDRPVIREESPLRTEGDPYGVTKAEGDRIILDAAGRGLQATILRPGAILGVHPTSTWAVRVPERIRDRQVKLRIDGRDTLPWVHIEDLVDAILLAVVKDLSIGRVYNMVDGHTTWLEYTDRVRRWFGMAPLEILPRGEVPKGAYWTGRFDAGRIRSELGYAPRRTFDGGMAEAGRYWRQVAAR